MKLQYRAIEGTNTKTRRLAYLTAILLILRQSGLSEQLLLKRLTTWSLDHQNELRSYYVHTGEITSTQKNSASLYYLDLAVRLKLIVPLSGMYQITRIGSVLVALMKSYEPNPNHFFLNLAEKIFYTYCILKADADIFLTIVDSLFKEDASLISLQQTFQEKFLKRLDVKILTVQDERVRLQLRDRLREVKEWGKPERYAEHLVPPRLNWLLDLGFLEPIPFRQHCFKSTGAGQLFLSSLLCIGEPCFHDVSDQWLDLEYWQIIAQTLVEIGSPVNWMGVDLETQYNLMGILLAEAFHLFRYSFVPRISLIQIMLYLSIRLLLDHHIVASPAALTEWFSSARVMDERRYEVRLSPRENESYLIIL